MAGLNFSHFMSSPITDEKKLITNRGDMKTRMELLIMEVQAKVCRALEAEEQGQKFVVDRSMRPGGGSITCTLQGGQVFEKAGINVSVAYGILPPAAVEMMRAKRDIRAQDGGSLPYFVAGIGSAIHPRNPMVPTTHFNYRYFEIEDGGRTQGWFGGGSDLTPYYIDEDDCTYYHEVLKQACDKHDETYYNRFKKWCDKYFYIPHREEHRGIGGLFFDDLELPSLEEVFQFVSTCAEAIVPSYVPLVAKHKDDVYGEEERQWQLMRRGRYVEFNLMCDRGTLFGKYIKGLNCELYLMPLPPLLTFITLMRNPDPSTPEGKLIEVLKKPVDWLELGGDSVQ